MLLAARRGEEAVVAGAEHRHLGRLAHHRHGRLGPGTRVERVGARLRRQHADRIIVAGAGARRIGQEQVALGALQEFRPFVDRIDHAFPWQRRPGDHRFGRGERPGVAQLPDRQPALAAFELHRIDEIRLLRVEEHCAVDRRTARVDAAAVDPAPPGGIGARILQHEHAAVEVVVPVVGRGGIIDIPFAADPVQLGRPDRPRVGTLRRRPPHRDLRRGRDPRDVARLADGQPVAARHHQEIGVAGADDPGIGAGAQDRIGELRPRDTTCRRAAGGAQQRRAQRRPCPAHEALARGHHGHRFSKRFGRSFLKRPVSPSIRAAFQKRMRCHLRSS